MIITASRNQAVSSGVSEVVDYKIDASNLGHIASILRKAYSDPIRAVVREYGTNACEAHILNGNQKKPFEVTLPTGMNPKFTIRDFGPGLGVDRFKNLFCSYGGSDKRASNEFTGCLGIGCKSYGAYTDSCTVTDHNSGTKRIWNCYIDETEVGKASLLSEVKSTEVSGVELTFPIRPSDVERFRRTAIQVYRVFDVKPTIKNITKEEREELDKAEYKEGSVKGDSWVFRGDGTSWLQMGLVLYPLRSDFSGNESIRKLINAGIYLRVDVGDVQIAPSREDLQYSQKTIQGLSKHMLPIFNALGDSLVKSVESAGNFYEAHRLLYKFARTGNYSSSDFRETIVKKMKGKLKWQGLDLFTDYELPLATNSKNAKGDITQSAHDKLSSHGVSLLRMSKRNWGRNKFVVDRETTELIASSECKLLINEGKVVGSGEARVRYWLTDGGGPKDSTIIVLSCKNGGKQFLETSLPWFKHVPFESIENLPKVPPKSKAVDENGDEVEYTKDIKHGKGNVFGLMSEYRHQDKRSSHWGIAPAPTTGKKVFVVLDQFKWMMPGKKFQYEEYLQLYRAKDYLKAIGYCSQIYGVKQADVEKKTDATWTMLHEAIECGTRTFLKDNPDKAQKIADRLAAISYFSDSRGIYRTDRFKEKGCFFEQSTLFRWVGEKTGKLDEVNSDSPFRIFMEKIMEMLGGKTEINDKKLPAWLDEPTSSWALGRSDCEDKNGVYRQLKASLPKPSYDLKTEGTKIASRYPLFCGQGKWQTDVMGYAIEGTVEYVHLVDAARKTK